MKIKALIGMCLLVAGLQLQAQHVRVRLNFPVGVRVNAPGPSPRHGAIWIGPEWRWQRGQYVTIPGYWASPQYSRAVWVPGHWQYTRRGYKWVPGRWR